MAENIDLRDANVITTILNEVNYSERERMQRHQFQAYQVYKGAVKPFVQRELQRTRPKSWRQYTVSDISVSSMIVNKLATAYNEDPIRVVSDSPERTDNYDDILKETQANRFFKEFDQIFNLQREALFWVNYRPSEEKWQYMALSPYEYSLVRDKDTGEVQVVILHYPSNRTITGTGQGDGKSDLIAESQDDGSAESDTYAMWSKDQHVVVQIRKQTLTTDDGRTQLKLDVTFVPITDNPEMVNPLGELPFVYLSQDMAVDNPYLNPITEQTITFNAMWSELLTAANIQGTGQFVLKYPEKYQGSMDNLAHGITTAIELPQSSNPDDAATDASYINPSPDLSGQRESYMSYLRQVLAQHGISTSQGVDGDVEAFSSGLERMIAQADVQQIKTQNQNLYSGVEKHVFEIVKKWDELIARSGGQRLFQDDDELSIIFPKPKVLVSDGETIANIKQLMDLGLMRRVRALMKLDPNLSEDEALMELELIDQERMTRVGNFLIGRQGNEDSGSESDGSGEGEAERES